MKALNKSGFILGAAIKTAAGLFLAVALNPVMAGALSSFGQREPKPVTPYK